MIKFRLSENLALDYSDFVDEGLRVAVFARSGGGKSNLAALFAEQALEQGLQTLVIEPLREYNTLKELYVVVWGARGGDLLLVIANPEPYGLDNDMSLDDFTGKQVDVTACVIKEGGCSSIRLKCPKHIINTLGIPRERAYNSPYKDNTDTVSYGVTGSSMRINLRAAFAHLFQGENGITATIKVSEDKIELFHKEDGKSIFPIFKSARYADGWNYCSYCQCFYQNIMSDT
jgi:hypothetical protein